MSKREKVVEEDPILFYERRFYCFSTFSAFAVNWGGRVWMTAEHSYQAAKFTDRKIQNLIFDARSAHLAKEYGHRYPDQVRTDWKKTRVETMEHICRAKLRQHAFVQMRLRESGKRELIENSDKDVFWGWGPNQRGQNMLGKIWVKLRSERSNIW